MPNLEPALAHALDHDREYLKTTKVPMVTVSGAFREDVKRTHGFADDALLPDIVFSRAHYSMALGVAIEAWGAKVSPHKAWAVDPTNYVSHNDWKKVEITELVGKTLARHSRLKAIKDFIDKFGRNKLPILSSITPPLLYLFEGVDKPILSLHIAAGNILVENGHPVVQVITDPHVRDDYLNNAHLPIMRFCVFDERTKTEFLEKAKVKGIKADPNRVVVTGPPIDPRIIAARHNKHLWTKDPLKLVITTGGLGTNKGEIETLLTHLLPELRKRPTPYQLLVYAGTQKDIAEMVKDLAKDARVPIEPLTHHTAGLRMIYHPQIVDANELLIKHGFPWAHGFISKPSGDMAYDAVAAGCFLLTLKEWGEWEHNIREVFEQKDISRPAIIDSIVKQLTALSDDTDGESWIHQAMQNSQRIEKLFLQGSRHILQAAQE
jgi:hypothetical protein